MGYRPWGHKESDTTEHTHTHTHTHIHTHTVFAPQFLVRVPKSLLISWLGGESFFLVR